MFLEIKFQPSQAGSIVHGATFTGLEAAGTTDWPGHQTATWASQASLPCAEQRLCQVLQLCISFNTHFITPV